MISALRQKLPLYTFMQPRTTLSQKFYRLCLLSVVLLLPMLTISSCAEWLPDAYRMELQQGNTITRKQLDTLKIGMSKQEVHNIIGYPILADPFHNQRWDYIYRLIPRKGAERKSRLTLYFNNNLLQRIDDSDYIEP